MKNLFTQVPVQDVRRNLFDLSHEVKMSGKFGYLYPCLVMDCLPGDTIRDTMTAMVRFAPMLAPVMHRIDVKTDFFFCPARLVSESWEDFITGGQDGTAAPVLSYFTPAGIAAGVGVNSMRKGTIWDYFGLPVYSSGTADSTEQISALPFKAAVKIFNDYFRDPNLDEEVPFYPEEDGAITDATKQGHLLTLRQRGWDKGYFISALPFAQRGPSVLMPFDAEINYLDQGIVVDTDGNPVNPTNALLGTGSTFVAGALRGGKADAAGLGYPINIQNIESISGGNITINDLRRTIAIQRWLENNARGGARYNEQILSHFNTRVPDYRLQRAEYLGGGRQPVQISEVVATAETLESSDQPTVPVGDLAGHGISVGKTNRFTYRCQEHGFIIGFISIVPKSGYSQGIPRLWSRRNKFDFAWPELAHLGEQEIVSKELFFSFDSGDDDENQEVFGYIPRYSEYKYMEDRIAGDFRDSLAFWHLNRMFVARPSLTQFFVRMEEDGGVYDEGYRRIFAVTTNNDYLWMQLFHRLTAKRPLPYFGVPQL